MPSESGGRASRARVERLLPLGYFAVALALIIFVLPTVLRPPPDSSNSSAELSPDTQSDVQESIVSNFSRGVSGTAGAGEAANGEPGAAGPGAVSGPGAVAAKGPSALPRACPASYGNPPRQLESVYSPRCHPAFVGDNGGSTDTGVTPTEIRIGLVPDLTGTRGKGEIPETEAPGESATNRTYRVLRDYFNRNMQFYGRQMRLFYCDGDPAPRAACLSDEFHVFGAIGEFSTPTSAEVPRKGITLFNNLVVATDKWFNDRAPYLFGSRANASRDIELGSEYICNRLANEVPFPTGDSVIDYSKPRKFGLIALNNQDSAPGVTEFENLLKTRCGIEPVVVTYTLDTSDQGVTQPSNTFWSTAASRFRQAGVSSVLFMGEILTLGTVSQTFDEQGYFPEWVVFGYGGFETSPILTRSISPRQWSHAFGFSFEEIPRKPGDTECFRAYHSIDPNNDPDANICNVMWHNFVFLSGAIQEAGPNLTHKAVEQAMFRTFRRPAEPVWSMGGGFSPTDRTYGDYAAELWYDPSAIAPDGQPGAYRYPHRGRRFQVGGAGSGRPTYMFQEGITDGATAGP